jgi:hypothetical protein
VIADGAYDGAPTYQTLAVLGKHIRIVIPPHVTAVLSDEAGYGWKPSPIELYHNRRAREVT